MSYAKLTEARLDAVASAACRLLEDESEWKREKKGRSDRRWVSQRTGAVKYSDTNPGAARKGRGADAAGGPESPGVQAKPRGKPAAAAEPKPTEDSLKARLSAVLSGKDLPNDAAALAREFMALTKPQLRKIMDGVAKKIGKDKAAMARNLADAALEYGRHAAEDAGPIELEPPAGEAGAADIPAKAAGKGGEGDRGGRVRAGLAAQYGGSDEAMAWLGGLSDDDLAGLGFAEPEPAPRRRKRPEPPISLSGAMDDAPDEDEAPFTRRPPRKSERAGDSPAEREARIRKYRERAGRNQDIFGESVVRGLGRNGELTPAQRARLLELRAKA